MQLDRTHVVVRLRTLSEIGDLALIMIRRYPASLLIGFTAGAMVWAILNTALLGWIPLQEADYGLNDEEAVGELTRYMFWMAVLVLLQAPAAGVLTTLYLGQAVFEQRPTWASVFKEAKRQFPRWFWVLGVQRLAIPTMILLIVRWGEPLSGFWDVFVPICLLLFAAIVRSSRPFVPEIILLEQCPLRSKSDLEITLARRSKSLHGPMASDLGGRFLAVSFVLLILLVSVLYSLVFVRGITLGNWRVMDLLTLLVFIPLALWTVAAVSVLVRLLNYLDTRIRLEGWEVELAVRAEAMREFGENTGLAVTSSQSNAHGSPARPTKSVKASAATKASGSTASSVTQPVQATRATETPK
ncbi:MAG: hypothetical protein P8L85_22450 [Rubripirellula sp.]|nr:hypothetical protein [Rubripirellula sp.]